MEAVTGVEPVPQQVLSVAVRCGDVRIDVSSWGVAIFTAARCLCRLGYSGTWSRRQGSNLHWTDLVIFILSWIFILHPWCTIEYTRGP